MSGNYRGTHGFCNICKKSRKLLYFNDGTRKVCEDCYLDSNYFSKSRPVQTPAVTRTAEPNTNPAKPQKQRKKKRQQRNCATCNKWKSTYIDKETGQARCDTCYKKQRGRKTITCSQCNQDKAPYGVNALLKPLCVRCHEIYKNIGKTCGICESIYKVRYKIDNDTKSLQCKKCYDKKRHKRSSRERSRERNHNVMPTVQQTSPALESNIWLL